MPAALRSTKSSSHQRGYGNAHPEGEAHPTRLVKSEGGSDGTPESAVGGIVSCDRYCSNAHGIGSARRCDDKYVNSDHVGGGHPVRRGVGSAERAITYSLHSDV